MDNEDDIKKIAELMDGAKIGSLTTVNESGQLISRPMGLQEYEFDGELWFVTNRNSNKIQHISTNPKTNVMFNNGNNWVSMNGTAKNIDDNTKAQELWNPLLKAWFPEGPGDPDLTLLKVTVERVEYWEGDGKIGTIIETAKALLTGEEADMGENKTVEL